MRRQQAECSPATCASSRGAPPASRPPTQATHVPSKSPWHSSCIRPAYVLHTSCIPLTLTFPAADPCLPPSTASCPCTSVLAPDAGSPPCPFGLSCLLAFSSCRTPLPGLPQCPAPNPAQVSSRQSAPAARMSACHSGPQVASSRSRVDMYEVVSLHARIEWNDRGQPVPEVEW
jgi:hypothetical protein